MPPPPPVPIRRPTKVAQSSELPDFEWYVLVERERAPYEAEWQEYSLEHETMLNAAYKAYVAGNGVGSIELYISKKQTWLVSFKDEDNFFQKN